MELATYRTFTTLDGVFQLILNNKSSECRRIKEYVAASVLPDTIFRFRNQALSM
jgi:hypothetical protein